MDTAKFCGNCGNSFPRPSEPTSSLVNCPQGHVYSAVYQNCPYCPQPGVSEDSAFVTRIEEQATSIDPLSTLSTPPQSSPADFVTRVETAETLFETSETPAAASQTAETYQQVLAPTEVITAAPAFESIIESTQTAEAITEEAASPAASSSSETFSMNSVAPQSPPAQTAEAESWAPKPPAPPEVDRRTIIMAEQSSFERSTKGKIVGWLISYSRNPDGEDFRIYEGYNRLGANPVCDIVIEDETVSGSHAIIVFRDGRCLIKDDLSRNGTFVNGREITEAHQLQNYDQIRVGNSYLTFIAAQRLS
jgi:hypothetical protein